VAHVAAHEPGAAAYAIKAVGQQAPAYEVTSAGRLSAGGSASNRPWQSGDLVLDDQMLRNDICWSVFET
jgi:hypothetical protein